MSLSTLGRRTHNLPSFFDVNSCLSSCSNGVTRPMIHMDNLFNKGEKKLTLGQYIHPNFIIPWKSLSVLSPWSEKGKTSQCQFPYLASQTMV